MTTPNTQIPPDFPAVTTPDEAGQVLTNYTQFGKLTNIQRTLLMAMVTDILSEKQRSYVQLAKDLGINRHTIYNSLANPSFNGALGLLMVAIARGESHVYMNLMRKKALEGDYRATKFMLEYGGTYTKKLEQRNVNVHVDGLMSSGNVTTLDDAVRQFLISLGNKGWSIERLVGIWDELKAQQAF